MNECMNTLLPFLQPIVQILTDFVQMLNSAPYGLKLVFTAFMAAAAILFGPAKAFLNGIAQAKGFQAGMQGGNFLKSIKTGLGGVLRGGGGGNSSDYDVPSAETSTRLDVLLEKAQCHLHERDADQAFATLAEAYSIDPTSTKIALLFESCLVVFLFYI